LQKNKIRPDGIKLSRIRHAPAKHEPFLYYRRRPNWSSADSREQTGADETGLKDIGRRDRSRLGHVRQQLDR
jgi:hypothetical protein